MVACGRVCYLRVSLILLPIWGSEIPPPTLIPNFGGVNWRFNPNRHNIKSFTVSNYCIPLNQFLHNDKDHQAVILVGPNTRPTDPGWPTDTLLKAVKSPYLRNRFTDFDEIWHGDAHWLTTGDESLKFEFLIIQGGGGRQLESHKNRDISATV